MKKVILSFVTIACSMSFALAQNYDDIKDMLLIRNFKKAKEMLDKSWSNAKFVSKPEAYIMRATIYTNLALDSSLSSSQAAQFNSEAVQAYNAYKEQDPTQALVKEPAYGNTPALVFNSLLNRGIKEVQSKNWDSAVGWFKQSAVVSEYLIKEKQIAWSFDTLSNFYGGISAQNSGKLAEAQNFYAKVAEKKITGPDYVNMYHFLVYNSFKNNDTTSFRTYKALGLELFPNDEFFKADESEFIVSVEDPKEKFKLIEQKLAADPNNYTLQSVYAETIFDQLNPKDTNTALPANYDELEAKMIAAFTKATELKPESGLAMSNLGNHYINKAGRIGRQLDSVRAVIRQKNTSAKPAATKPGAKPAPVKTDPADAAARDELTKKYDDASDKAMEYYQKAVDIYGKVPAPTSLEKQQYRNAVSYLIDLSGEKKNKSKGTPALYDKWEKEEKKWSDLYHKM
jgi:hypothetical protein